jgi:hypothetical protein
MAIYNSMYPCVIRVVPQEDFSLQITFDNGVEGVLDIKPYLDFGIFKRLKDKESFKRVSVAFDTVEWECGVDLDPEFIFNKIQRRSCA